MKRVKYRTEDVNQVDWRGVRSRSEGKALVFSVDIAKHAQVGLLLSEAGEVIALLRWTHPEDSLCLIERLSEGLGAKRLTVVMEPTGTYGDALRWQFKQRGCEVYRVNPKYTHDESESFDGVPSSHDAKAACIIADLHSRGRSEVWREGSLEQRELRALVNELEVHQTVERANLNRLNSLLSRHWPEFERVLELKRVSSLRLLSEYGSPSAVAATAVGAQEVLRQASQGKLDAAKREAVVNSARSSLGVPCSAGETAYLQHLASELLHSQVAQAKVEAQIGQFVDTHEEMKELSRLCGKVTSVVLVALLGDLRAYTASSLLKAAGLNLKEHSSGKHKGQLKMTKRGPSKVRFYLYWLSLRLIDKDAHINAWYGRKVARDGGRYKGRAITAVMRKVVKALPHVAQGSSFDSRKLFVN